MVVLLNRICPYDLTKIRVPIERGFMRVLGLIAWIPEIRNESFDRVSPIIYFQEQPTAV